MNSVEDRLSKLERSNRWWRFTALLVFGIASLRCLTGAAEPASFDTLTAVRIQIVDPKGNIVGALSGQDGLGALELSSSNSKSTVAMAATTQPAIALADADGTQVAFLGDNPLVGGGDLELISSHSKSQVVLAATTQPSIALENADGKTVASLVGSPDGGALLLPAGHGKGGIILRATTQPLILLTNANNTPAVSIGDSHDGAGSVNVYSAKFIPTVSIDGDDDGAGSVTVCSAAGKKRVALFGHLGAASPWMEDTAGISLGAENGEPRAFIMADGATACLGLLTHNGQGASVDVTASDVAHTGIKVSQPGDGGESHLP